MPNETEFGILAKSRRHNSKTQNKPIESQKYQFQSYEKDNQEDHIARNITKN